MYDDVLVRVICTRHGGTNGIVALIGESNDGLWLCTGFQEHPRRDAATGDREADVQYVGRQVAAAGTVRADCPTCGPVDVDATALRRSADLAKAKGKPERVEVH